MARTLGRHSKRRAFLGIDCGTASTKALLLEAETTAILTVGRAQHELIGRADGTREQRPEWWVAAAISAVREAVRAAEADGGPIEIAGIGVSGQQHGLVALDDEDRPLLAAKLWNDTTTVDQATRLTERLGGREAVLRLTGNLFLPGYTASKVSWLMEHEPDIYARSERLCLPHDYLDLWLTGTYATEAGDASGTAYLDVCERRYSQPVLAAIDDGRDWQATLPPLIPSTALLGALREQAADALGIPAGTPVSAGGGDNMCTAIGVGATRPGPVVLSLGSSGTAFAYSPVPALDPHGEAAAFCDSTDAWLPLACTLNCTTATDWIRDILGLDHDGFDAVLAGSEAGADGLTFLPYLDGERTPDLPGATGTFVGLRTTHDRAALLRAVVEGVTFGSAYALEAVRRAGVMPTEITLVGGGARSDPWAQLVADVLDLPVARPAQVEAAALGAAMQARWAVDGEPPSASPGRVDRFEPDGSEAIAEAAARQANLRRLAMDGALPA